MYSQRFRDQSLAELKRKSAPAKVPAIESKEEPTEARKPVASAAPSRRPATKAIERKPGPSRQQLLFRSKLSAATAGAEDVLKSLTLKSKVTDPVLLSLPSKLLIVGKLECKTPSPVKFFANRLEYTFYHPYEAKQIRMVMFYRDMSSIALSSTKRRLDFKIPKQLCHFGSDYESSDPRHVVGIVFDVDRAVSLIRSKVLSLMKQRH